MTTQTTTRGNSSSTRVRIALSTAAGAMLCAGFAGGLALRHTGAQHSQVGTAAVSRPAADTMGGYAEYLLAQPVTRTVAASDATHPLGGYAEFLRSQQEAPRSAISANTGTSDTMGGYAEFLRDHPAEAAAASVRVQGTSAEGGSGPVAAAFGFAGDGRPMGGYAEWLVYQAQ